MRLSRFSFVLALLLPAAMVHAQADLSAGTSHFTILQGDKTVGASEFTVTPTPAGFTISSRGDLHLSKFSYSFTDSQNLDRVLNLVSDQITGTVNGSQVTFSARADQSGREFQIDVNAKGQDTQNTVDRHQHLALLPDLDSAGYMLLTRIGLENPAVSWVLIPKQNGLLVPSVYTRDASVPGRIDGRDIDVQHTTVAISAQNSVNVELFYSQDGRLLEADLPEQNFYVVLDGFKLINRPKFAPPRSPDANEPPPQQGSQQYSAPQSAPPPQYTTPQGAPPPQMQQQ
ncbi:MAG TPA: hypothetical protein VFW25_11870 [Silvibacterium sp.]|nr:hypothetical protein [Silvibacterium sp.]